MAADEMDESAPDEVEETPEEWLERSFEERRADERYGRTTTSIYVAESRTPIAGFRGGRRP